MRRFAAILLVLLACLTVARGQTSVEHACVILITNAANSNATWLNDGTDPLDFTQATATRQPTNEGTHYSFGIGCSLTSSVAAAGNTNKIVLSCWLRDFSPGASPGVLALGTWDGSGGNPGLMMMVDGGTVYIGTRIPDNFFYGAFADSTTNHHLFLAYDHSRTNEILAYVDGVKLTSHAGTYGVARGVESSPVMSIGGHVPATFANFAKSQVAHGLVITNYAGDANWLASNIFANGCNFYDPSSPPPAAGDPSMNREAAGLYLDLFQ